MSQAMNMMTDMAMQSVRSSNLDTERSRLNNISNSKDSALKEKELRKAAEGFEAIFIQKMWDEMRSSLPKNGMHYSKEEEYWQSMYSQELGKSMASAGGIGLADMMVEQLTKPAVVSPQTGALSRIRMAVEPAPLVPETPKTAQQAEQKAEQTAQNSSRPLSRGNRDLAPNFYEEFNPQAPITPNAASAAGAMALQNQAEHNSERQAQSQQASNRQEQQKQQEQLAQPQIVRTTYITNLPPEKRSHAILDRKGNPVKKAENTRANEISVPTRSDYFDRSLSINRTIRAEHVQNSDLTVNNQNMQAMQAEQKPEQPAQAARNTAEKQDILAGISTTYIPYHQRMAQQTAMQRTAEASQIPQVQEIQQPQQAQSPRTFKLPSLEEALNMGTLVASISDEELAGVRQKQETQRQETKNSISSQAGQTRSTAKPAALHREFNTAPADTGMQNTAQHAVSQNISQNISQNGKPFVSALAPQTDFAMPAAGTITSHFGWRFNPETRQREWHKGIDLEAGAGSAVRAGKAGTVTFAGYDETLGSTVIIDHGSGIESVYAHAGELSVKVGDVISSGTQIAKLGTDKDTQKARLHFEIRQNGLSINPEPYFSKEEIS